MIKTTQYKNDSILKDILHLYCNDAPTFECDLTFSVGNFYQTKKEFFLPYPPFKYDKFPANEDVHPLDKAEEELEDDSLNSVIADPPFLIGTSKSMTKMAQRFTKFQTEDECKEANKNLLTIAYHKLKKGGILAYKIQDTKISADYQSWEHIWLYNMAEELGFKMVDMFVLVSNNNGTPLTGTQRSAKKNHSYIMVFKKK